MTGPDELKLTGCMWYPKLYRYTYTVFILTPDGNGPDGNAGYKVLQLKNLSQFVCSIQDIISLQ